MWSHAEDMDHVDPVERERLKREMGAFLDLIAGKPYVGLRRMQEHRWGGLRLWPKWKSVRKIWLEEREAEAEDIVKSLERASGELDEEWTKPRNEKEWREAKKKAARRAAEDCQRCQGEAMANGWKAIKWRPVVSYSRNHMRGILGMVGKWAIFVIRSLNLGIAEDSTRRVTEKVHRLRRTAKDWEEKKVRENQEADRKRRKGRRSRMRHRTQSTRRVLERTIWDLSNFFIKVPRGDFFRNVMKDLMRRIKEAYPNQEWF